MPITTQQVFDEFFAGNNLAKKNRASVDNQAFRDFLNQLGKNIIELTPTDWVAYFDYLKITKTQKNMISLYRRIIDSYILNHDVNGVNPLNHVLIKKYQFAENIIINDEYVDGVFKYIAKHLTKDKALYSECIIRLLLSGVKSIRSIIEIKDSDIDFENLTIFIESTKTVIHIDKHTADSIVECQKLFGEEPSNSTIYEKWNDCFFPISRKKHLDVQINQKSADSIKTQVNQMMRSAFPDYDVSTFRLFYYYGFYKHLIGKYDKEYIDKNIKSARSEEGFSALLRRESDEFGISSDYCDTNISNVKSMLASYIVA